MLHLLDIWLVWMVFRGLLEDSLKFSRSSGRDQPPISAHSKETSNPAPQITGALIYKGHWD